MAAADAQAILRYFPQGGFLLLIDSYSPNATGRVFYLHRGAEPRLYLEMPFDRARHAEYEPSESGPGRKLLSGPFPGRLGSSAGMRWLAVIAVLILAGVLGFALLNGFQKTYLRINVSQDPKPVLGLTAERQGGQWRVTWRPDAALRLGRAGGRLSVLDGYLRQDLNLSSADLGSGQIVYSPSGDDVTFRLEVFDRERGRSVGESVRVLAAGSSGNPDAVLNELRGLTADPRARPDLSLPESVRRSGSPAGKTRAGGGHSARGEESASERSPREGGSVPEGKAVAAGSTERTFLEPVPTAQTTAPALPAPPEVRPSSALTSGQVDSIRGGLQDVPYPEAEPERVTKVGGKLQPPILLRRIDPVYPAEAARTRISGVVKIRATIGQDGRVRAAHVVAGPEVLGWAAVDAVKRWVYKPGVLNGQPIQAEADISIYFTNAH